MKAIRNLNQIVSMQNAYTKDGRNLEPNDLSIIESASIVYDDEQILWVGMDKDLPTEYKNLKYIDGKGKVLTPGLADSHTHLVFGGNRSKEYTMRLNGADYEEIGKAGGGILSTMKATLDSSAEDLFKSAVDRINRICSYGVKAIEIKSGYALTYEKEKEITILIDRLKQEFKGKVLIHNTFMAAHAIPKEFVSSTEYINEVVIKLLNDKDVTKIIDSVDIFFEDGYFTKEDTILLFDECNKLNIKTRIHADEFNDNKGAILATKYNSLSADHLLCTTRDGIEALSNSSTVATVLPGTAFFLGKPLANAKEMLKAGCKVAIASDYNPGSSHCDNILLVASLAAKNMEFNIAELWSAITINGYASMNMQKHGVIKVGHPPVISLFDVKSVDELTYFWGRNFYNEAN